MESIPREAPLKVALLRGKREILAEIAHEWRTLCDEGPCNEPFLRPEWIESYVDAFAPKARMLLITARAGARLRAVLPLIERRVGIGPLGITGLRGAATVHSARFGMVHGRDDGEFAVQAIADHLKKWRRWDWLQATLMPDGQALHRVVKNLSAAGCPTAAYTKIQTSYMFYPEPGTDLTTYLEQMPSNFRKKLRKGLRLLEELGEVRFVHTGPEAGEAAILREMEAFADLEQRGWKGKAGTAIACDAATRLFYDNIGRAGQEHGYASFYRLDCGGKPVAIQIGVVSGDREYFALKFAYDEDYRQCSPGHLITLYMLVDGPERGYRVLNLGGSVEDHKLRWTPLIEKGANHLVFRSGLRGRLLGNLLLPFVLRMKRRLVAGVRVAHERGGSTMLTSVGLMLPSLV